MTAPGAATPAATAPGRAAYEAVAARIGGEFDSWDRLPAKERAAWTAGIEDAIKAAKPHWSERLGPVIACDHSPAELGVTIDGTSLTGRVAELRAALGDVRRALVRDTNDRAVIERAVAVVTRAIRDLSGSPDGGGGRDAQA